MRVDQTSKSSSLSKSGRAKKARSGENFTIDLSQEVEPQKTISPVASTQNVDALIALQMVDDQPQGKQKNLDRGRQLLDTLEDLRIDLLTGRVTSGRIENILALLESRQAGTDPKLEALVDEVELRARVELAKLNIAKTNM